MKKISCFAHYSSKLVRVLSLSAAAWLLAFSGTAQAATATWDGSIDGNWNAISGGDSNWGGGLGTNGRLASGDSAVFTLATGIGGLNLNNDLTSGAFNLAGITFNAGAAAFVIGDGTATPNAGNTFVLTGNVTNNGTNLETINNPFSMSGTRTFTPTNVGGDITLGGNISGTGALTKTGAGTLTLSGANTYSAGTILSAGTLNLNGTHTSAGTFSVQGGTLNVNGTETSTLTNINFSGGSTTNVSGTLNLHNSAGASNIIGQLTAATLVIQSGGLVDVQSGGFLLSNGNGSSGTVTLQAGGALTFQDALGGTNSFKIGGQNSANTGTGTFNLDGGTLTTPRPITAGAGTSNFRFNGGTLKAGASSTTFMQGLSTTLVRDGGALIDTQNFNITIAQALLHSNLGGDNAIDGGLTKSGSGTLTLSGANTYTGVTTVSDGTLAYGSSNRILTGGVTVNGASAIYSLGTFSDSVGTVTLDGGGQINSSTGVLTSTGSFEMKNGSASAILAGGVALNKTTSSTVTLSGANTYTGTTTVSGGTLLANTPVSGTDSATGFGAVTVGAGGTLGGTGQIRPTGANGITVDGILAPGASTGTLTIDSGGKTLPGILTMSTGSSFNFELGSAGPSIGSFGTSDLLVINGSDIGDVVFNNNAIDFLATGSIGFYKLFDTDLADATDLGDTWSGLTYDPSSGLISSGLMISNLNVGLCGTLLVGTVTNGGNLGDIYLNVTAIPEPSTLVIGSLFGLGLAVYGLRRRRQV